MTQVKTPPGPRGQFLIRNTLQYVRDPLGFLTQASRKHGDVVRLRLGHLGYVLLANPEHIEFVLRTHPENFIKDKLTRMIKPLIGNGLVTSEGAFWRRQRKLAQPAFQHEQIQRYGQVMVEYTERMLAAWRDGQVFDVHEALMGLTLGIVAKTLFDADMGAQARVVGEAMEVVMSYNLKPWKWFRIR